MPEPPLEMPQSSDSGSELSMNPDEDFNDPIVYAEESSKPKLFSQADLNDLVRDLGLAKTQSELLASRLHERNLLEDGVHITKFRTRSDDLLPHFSLENGLCYCNNIPGLFEDLNITHDPQNWRLFIDASLYSTKGVLLHNGNVFPSIPVAHSVTLRETYENLKFILIKIKYEEFKWPICADLKVVALLTGLQTGFTKYMCFLCKWDSRSRSEHYIRSDWPSRDELTVGSHNVVREPLVEKEKVILPPYILN